MMHDTSVRAIEGSCPVEPRWPGLCVLKSGWCLLHRPFFSGEDDMSKAKWGATCAAVVLSCAFVSAQTSNQGRSPDKPLPNSAAAKSPQTATISGCVVRDAANGGQPTITSNGIS